MRDEERSFVQDALTVLYQLGFDPNHPGKPHSPIYVGSHGPIDAYVTVARTIDAPGMVFVVSLRGPFSKNGQSEQRDVACVCYDYPTVLPSRETLGQNVILMLGEAYRDE